MKEKKLKPYEMETDYFTLYNRNPKNKKVGDCVIRAISLATGKTWEEVLTDLFRISLKIKDVPTDKKTYTEYLATIGYYKQPQPRKDDNTKYTIREFAQEHKKGIYVVDMANHCTCVINGKIHDLWNCGNKSVGNYWIIK